MSEAQQFIESHKAEIEAMFDFLEEVPQDEAQALVERLTTINVLMARSGRLLAEAKYIQDRETALLFMNSGKEIAKMSPTIAAKFINASCFQINEMVNKLERANRAMVHCGDNIRTQISFAKQDMALQRKGY